MMICFVIVYIDHQAIPSPSQQTEKCHYKTKTVFNNKTFLQNIFPRRLYAMNREVKLKELQLLDAARRKFLHFQKQQREAELRRLDDEVQRKVGNS